MKYTYLLAALMLLGSCSIEPTKPYEETTTEPELHEMDPEEAKQELAEVKLTDKLLGTWEFEDTKLGVTQEITYNEDGTYQMKMASMDISGTWELTDSVLITKSRPDAEGQKKTITQLTSDTLTTFWEPKGGKGREMKYVRAN